MFFTFCSIQINSTINSRFIPNNECILLSNSIFLNLFTSLAGGSIFCENSNKKLKILECSFRNIQSGSSYNGGAIYFNCRTNSGLYVKCCLAENCLTYGSSSHEHGQFAYSFVSDNSYNIFEDSSINKCPSNNQGIRISPFYIGYGIEIFEKNNISNIHVYYTSSIVFYSAIETYTSFCHFSNLSAINSMCINFCQGKNWFNYSNLINFNQLTSTFGQILCGCTGGSYTEAYISNCNFINHHNYLFQKTKGIFEIINCYISSLFTSNGISISFQEINVLSLIYSRNCNNFKTNSLLFFENKKIFFFILLFFL